MLGKLLILCWVTAYLMDVTPSAMYGKDRRSVLLRLFGKSPETRIIDLFLDNPLFEFTRNEVIESLGMAKSTLFSLLRRFRDALEFLHR